MGHDHLLQGGGGVPHHDGDGGVLDQSDQSVSTSLSGGVYGQKLKTEDIGLRKTTGSMWLFRITQQ